MFVDKMGAKDGLALYQNTKDRSISPELVEAISILLEKSKNDNLSLRTGSIVGEEILTSLIDEMDKLLPNYNKEKKEVFFNIIEEIIRYAKVSFTGSEKKRFKFIYSQEAGGLGQKALEEDLQDSMIVFFEHSKIADGLDHEKAKFVDGGRVDIVYKKDIITIPIELKKSLVRHDETSLEENYIAQAQTYASGYDQLGIFVLLELSDKSSEAPPDFRDWFKIHHLPPSTNMNIKYPNYIISIVIPGNRTLPSSKSNYK
ncbi:hypothetical protein [Tenacibaculum maritimum]|uniref:hypothetical protein n=1 Tax=Tenacibaculum maritimum TaxID=107401 RepID=UPI003875F8DE